MNEDKQPLNPENWDVFFLGGILTPFLVEDETHMWSD
jgi:hypothetical protein